MVKLYTVGIILKYGYAGNNKSNWWATIDFSDLKHCEDNAVQGSISTKYADDIEPTIDCILKLAKQLKLEFTYKTLYYVQDGESTDYPPPENWKQILKEQADRIGFETIYK